MAGALTLAALLTVVAAPVLAPWAVALLGALLVLAVGSRWREGEALACVETDAGRLQAILDSRPEALVVMDADFCIHTFSATAERMFGWSEREVQGQAFATLLPPASRPEFDRSVQAYLKTRRGGGQSLEPIERIGIAQRKDGSNFPMQMAIGAAMPDPQAAFACFVLDLTEPQGDGRLQELQSRLEQVSRLASLYEMVSALSHELNQPLAAIQTYVGGARRLLKSGSAPETVAEALDRVNAQSLRAAAVMRQARDFLQDAKAEARPESVVGMIEAAASLGLLGVKKDHIQLFLDLDQSADAVIADRLQIQKVLLSLIRNGIQAMAEAGRRHLTISSRQMEDGMVRITVADTGAGVSREALANLFRPFNSTKQGAAGVALSICRTIVEAHGGKIWLEERPEDGAVFHFTLPAADVARAAEAHG